MPIITRRIEHCLVWSEINPRRCASTVYQKTNPMTSQRDRKGEEVCRPFDSFGPGNSACISPLGNLCNLRRRVLTAGPIVLHDESARRAWRRPALSQ